MGCGDCSNMSDVSDSWRLAMEKYMAFTCQSFWVEAATALSCDWITGRSQRLGCRTAEARQVRKNVLALVPVRPEPICRSACGRARPQGRCWPGWRGRQAARALVRLRRRLAWRATMPCRRRSRRCRTAWTSMSRRGATACSRESRGDTCCSEGSASPRCFGGVCTCCRQASVCT